MIAPPGASDRDSFLNEKKKKEEGRDILKKATKQNKAGAVASSQ